VAVLLCAASAHAQEDACIAARYAAGGKYAGCEAKAMSKGLSDAGFVKCRQKYAKAWTKLGTKYPGTSCDGARFVDNGDGTITDKLTQLVWEKKDSLDGVANLSNRHDADNAYLWSAGASGADGTAFTDFLANLNSTGFAGQHDWRLPTLFELQSTVATDAFPSASYPSVVDPLFLPTQADFYWSSSTYQGGPGLAWTVYFNAAVTAPRAKTFPNYVRAVRAGS
jgi:hypothetical protein